VGVCQRSIARRKEEVACSDDSLSVGDGRSLGDDVLDDFNSGKIGISKMKDSLKESEFRKSEAFKRPEALEKGEV